MAKALSNASAASSNLAESSYAWPNRIQVTASGVDAVEMASWKSAMASSSFLAQDRDLTQRFVGLGLEILFRGFPTLSSATPAGFGITLAFSRPALA